MPTIRFFIFCCITALSLHAHERITRFVSDILVTANATLCVQETLEVISDGTTIIHGIVREFPTSYKRKFVIYNVDFNVLSVTHNGTPASFHLESVENGKKLYIGDKDVRLSTGKHTYTIIYTTNRQLGVFKDHDELYWNVTGNGWRLPIDTVSATVHLPANIPPASISAEGYTGFQSEQGKEYVSAINGTQITFATTRRLLAREGLTVVVTWPKGFVHEPTWRQKWYWFLRDNGFLIWTAFMFLLIFALILAASLLVRHKNKPGSIIPLFYPPTGFTPSMVGFMKHRKFKNQQFAADIVNLAVRGFITLSYTPTKFLQKDVYTLKLIKDPNDKEPEALSNYDIAVLSKLFTIKNSSDYHKHLGEVVILSKENAKIIDSALQKTSEHCQKRTGVYIGPLPTVLYAAYTMCFVWFFGALVFDPSATATTAKALGVLLGFLVTLATGAQNFYRAYTPQGRKLQDQIDGFELYLKTAELERMKAIGTPPTRTPELYEKYLPYAIALNVEKQWTQQFAAVFAALKQQGHAYTPIWYAGRPFNANSFASHVGSSFNSAITSAATPPGSSSGSRGGGSSGGGGGGGGGGGW